VLATHLSNAAEFEFMAGRRRVAQDFVTNWPPPYARGASPTLVMMSLYSGLGMAASLDEPRWSERLLDRARQLLGEQHDWQVAYALYLLSVGREASARTVLTPLLEAPTDEQLPLSEIVAFSLDSVLETIANNQFRAHSALYRALERADATGGYLEVTRVGSRRIAPILAAGLGRFGPHEHVARSLLSGTVGESVLDTGALTDRERDILQELKSLRTVEEIGHDVLLSANTVKTHMRNIYRKLDVTSRRQAVAKAEEIGLI
jgi:LuxR family maltose regulon positive regulatory protein